MRVVERYTAGMNPTARAALVAVLESERAASFFPVVWAVASATGELMRVGFSREEAISIIHEIAAEYTVEEEIKP